MLSHIERNSSLGYSLKISDISASTPTEKKTKKKIPKVKARWTHTSHEVIKENTSFKMDGYFGHQEIRDLENEVLFGNQVVSKN